MDDRIHSLIADSPTTVPSRTEVEAWLGANLALDSDTGPWLFYRSSVVRPPFLKTDARFARKGDRALVVVETADPVFEKDLDLDRIGPRQKLDINPRIPPEGTLAYTYRLGDQVVSLMFTAKSRRLLSIAF